MSAIGGVRWMRQEWESKMGVDRGENFECVDVGRGWRWRLGGKWRGQRGAIRCAGC